MNEMRVIVDEPDIEALARRADVHAVILTVADTMFKEGKGRESPFTKGGLWVSLSELSTAVVAHHPDWQLRGKPVQVGSMASAIQLSRKEQGYLELQAGMVRISEGGIAELQKLNMQPTVDVPLSEQVVSEPEKRKRGRPRKSTIVGEQSTAPSLALVAVTTPPPITRTFRRPQWRNPPPPADAVRSPTREAARRSGRKMRPDRTADKRIIYSMPGKVDKIPITALGFTAEQASELQAHGIKFIGQLRALNTTKLEKLGVNGRSLEVIRKLLEAHGLYLLGEDKLETDRPIHPVEDELLRRAGQDSFLFIRVGQLDEWPERIKKHLEMREIYILRDLVQQSAHQLRLKGIFGEDLDRIRATLAEYELYLAGESVPAKKLKPRIQRMRENGFYLTDMLLDLGEPKFADIEYARLLLGTDFPFFDAIRRGSPSERVAARNKLTVKNHRLALKASTKNPWHARFVENREDPAVDIEDIQQELYIALMYSLEGYDYGSGNKPSTYAFTWFRQAATRMLHNSGRVRVPGHQYEALNKYLKAQARLRDDLGRNPTTAELKEELGFSDSKFENLQAAIYWMIGEAVSTDAPTHNGHSYKPGQEGEEGSEFGDTLSLLREALEFGGPISDASRTGSVTEDIRQERVATAIYRVVTADMLMDVERHVIIRRFGLDGDEPETLEEIGERLGVTRERIRQRERDAMNKLRESDLWNDEILEGYHPEGLHTGEEAEQPTPTQVTEATRAQVAPSEPTPATPPPQHGVKPERVINVTCKYFNITQAEVKGSSRTQPLARRRQVIMYLLREICGCSYPEIGRLLERNHTSTIHGYEKIRELVETKSQPAAYEVDQLLRELNKPAE